MILSEELALAGMRLNIGKSAAFVPEKDREGARDTLITSVPQVSGGLPALGCAYGGEFEALLGPHSVAAAPARRRLEHAKGLAAECAAYRREGGPVATWQAAWHMLRSVVAKALVYDIRTLEPSASLPLAEELDRVVLGACKELACAGGGDCGWTAETCSKSLGLRSSAAWASGLQPPPHGLGGWQPLRNACQQPVRI